MGAPRINSIRWPRPGLPQGVFQACETRGMSLFVVEHGGTFGDRLFRAGELIVCGEGARAGESVVLVPRGRGRVRLGGVKGTSLMGDRGEVCSQARWTVAGHVKAIIRPVMPGERPEEVLSVRLPTPRGWVVEAWRQQQGRPVRAPAKVRSAANQLCLFSQEVRRAA
jgi:hypothetical protein